MAKVKLARGVRDDHFPELLKRLHELGWLFGRDLNEAIGNITEREFKQILWAYQHFHGLDAHGEHTAQTHTHIWHPRMCSHPDVMDMEATLPKWDNPVVTWMLKDAFPGLSVQDAQAAFAWAWQQWALVCGIKPVPAGSASTAQVLSNVITIDGPGGILGYSQLPDQTQTQRIQNFDSAEAWVSSPMPAPMKIDLNRVACHEIGHAIGIGHIGSGNLMAPIYSATIRSPQAGDIAEAVNRYGLPAGPQTPPPPALNDVVISVNGLISKATVPGFQVTKL